MNATPILMSGVIAFAATLSAGVFIKRFRSNIGILCAFSAGFFIALSLFELMPGIFSLAAAAEIAAFEGLVLPAAGGFFLLFALDRVFLRFDLRRNHMSITKHQSRVGLLSTLEFCSHGFIEGLAIGFSFQIQFGLGIFVAIAVVSHDFCDGTSTLTLMLNSGNSLKSSMGMLFVDAFAPVLGAITTLLLQVQDYLLVYALSFLLGSFLYIGGGTLLPDAYRMNRSLTTAVFFLIGFFLILLFAQLVPL